jgi:threonine dehydratase
VADGPDIEAARRRIAGRAHRTPTLRCRSLDALLGVELFLKAEPLQRTGSFKFRGATSALRALPPGGAGVVAVSSGNHAQAVACAARDAGLRALVVMPADSSRTKRAATVAYGAEVVSEGVDGLNREEVARTLAAERGWPLVHPFDDWDVISGQATAALELIEDAPDLDAIVAPIGGGGLLSGTALACAARAPGCAVWGAEPRTGDDAARSLAAGRRLRLEAPPRTIADGVRTVEIGERPFSVLRERCAGIALVDEDELRAALALLWSRSKLLCEPTSALPLAAIAAGRIPGRRIGVIVSGGNVDAELLVSGIPPP